MLGLVERGGTKRPRLIKDLRGNVEIRFREDFAPVRLEFRAGETVVEDGHGRKDRWRPDLVIEGSLPDIVQLAAAPLFGGLPNPVDRRGRAALASVMGRRVRIEGSPLLARRLLRLLEV
jgi:hypothetical protein